MKYFGVLAIIILLCYSDLPRRIKRLQSAVKRLNLQNKEKNKMSDILKELVGKKCKITINDDIFSGPIECSIIQIDDEWMRFSYIDKKLGDIIKIMRIDDLQSVQEI